MKNIYDLQDKTIVVTGATAGIGQATAHALALRGAHVIGVGRSPARCQALREAILAERPGARVSVAAADLASQRQIRQLAAEIRAIVAAAGEAKIDALVNNAGTVSSWHKMTEDGYELQFAVNHLAAFLLTHELMPLLGKAPSARVVTVSSASHHGTRMHWPDVMYRKRYNCLAAYKQSKLANVLFGQGEDAFVTCSGKGMTRTAARAGALGEALERYASLTWTPQRVVRCPRDGLTGQSLDPHELVLFAPEDAERLGHARYRDDLPLDWVPARSLMTGSEVWVPFQAVTLHGSRWPRRELLFAPTSNGFAAGPTVEFAAEQALLEVIERDAFCIAWAHRLATQPYDAGTLPDADAAALAELYRRRGVRIDVHLLPTDGAAFVAMAVGWGEEEPAAVVGLGAALDPLRAARSAVLEVGQVRPALRARLQDPAVREHRSVLAADPSRVHELEDHDLLYSDQGVAQAAMAHLRASVPTRWVTPPVRGRGLDDLVTSLVAVAGDVLIVDVTPSDVAALGVRVVRGIVPGFQPIHFGADQARLGHPRLFTAPHRWGLRDRPAERADLNPDPHPLA